MAANAIPLGGFGQLASPTMTMTEEIRTTCDAVITQNEGRELARCRVEASPQPITIDGRQYEHDLCPVHRTEPPDEWFPWLRVKSPTHITTHHGPRVHRAGNGAEYTEHDARECLREHGYPVADSGRLSKEDLLEYQRLNGMLGDLPAPGVGRRRAEWSTKRAKRVPDWDARPVKVEGDEREFFTIGALAKALGLPTNTVRGWEERDLLPEPFRSPEDDWRLYTRAQVEGIVRIAKEEGVLDGRPISTTDFARRVIALFRELGS